MEDETQTPKNGLPRPRRPESIDSYQVVDVLGEGGMGIVYLALQTSPMRREVAIKVVRAGLDSRKVLARFEAERQSLAMMNHRNIATVFDAGITEQGAPYFVMERVDGLPVDTFCDHHRLTIEQRLKLFQDVCSGIQHAHQKGMIHRDLKPNNILVTMEQGKPVPKIIDFGLAKATSQSPHAPEVTMTETGQIVGTVRYMAPEQARAGQLDVDTRCDVYSLGVILYELLVGVTPLSREAAQRKSLGEKLNWIQNREPLRPSSQIATSGDESQKICQARDTTPVRLVNAVRGDLDWILLKALEIDRNRRYPSASQFASDLEQFLQRRPVTARPPSASYRIQRMLQRNRVASVFSALLLLTLIAATLFSLNAAYRANEARKRSEADKQRAIDAFASVQEFVLDSPVWKVNNPGRDALIDKLASEYEYWAASPDAFDADVIAISSALSRLAVLQRELGRLEKSRVLAQQAIDLIQRQESVESMDFQLALAEAEEALVLPYENSSDVFMNSAEPVYRRLMSLENQDMSEAQAVRYCRIFQDLTHDCYRQRLPACYAWSVTNQRQCERQLKRFPKCRELSFVLAQCLNQVAISHHKGFCQPGELSRDDLQRYFRRATGMIEDLIAEGYRVVDCRRTLAQIISFQGLTLRVKETPADILLPHYDRGIHQVDLLLAEFPDNLEFRMLRGELMVNKSDALHYFHLRQEEEQLRQAADQWMSAVKLETSDTVQPARIWARNRLKLITLFHILERPEEARSIALEVSGYPQLSKMRADFGHALYYAIMQREHPVGSSEQEHCYQQAAELYQHFCENDISRYQDYARILEHDEVFQEFREKRTRISSTPDIPPSGESPASPYAGSME